MNRRELVKRLSTTAEERYGVRVTDSMFGDWLREKLIAAPRKRGQIREWTAKEYRGALEICRLKSQGVNFAGAIRWHLWIKGFDPPKFDPRKSRRPLLKEFRKFRFEATKGVYTTYDPRSEREISPARLETIARSIGTQDSRLHSILPFEAQQIVKARNLAEFDVGGEKISAAASRFCSEVLFHLIPGIQADAANEIAGTICSAIVGNFGGLTGKPDEIDTSSEASILCATVDTYMLARQIAVGIPSLLAILRVLNPNWTSGLDAARMSARTPHWRIGNFVAMLHFLHRAGPILEGFLGGNSGIPCDYNALCDIVRMAKDGKGGSQWSVDLAQHCRTMLTGANAPNSGATTSQNKNLGV